MSKTLSLLEIFFVHAKICVCWMKEMWTTKSYQICKSKSKWSATIRLSFADANISFLCHRLFHPNLTSSPIHHTILNAADFCPSARIEDETWMTGWHRCSRRGRQKTQSENRSGRWQIQLQVKEIVDWQSWSEKSKWDDLFGKELLTDQKRFFQRKRRKREVGEREAGSIVNHPFSENAESNWHVHNNGRERARDQKLP